MIQISHSRANEKAAQSVSREYEEKSTKSTIHILQLADPLLELGTGEPVRKSARLLVYWIGWCYDCKDIITMVVWMWWCNCDDDTTCDAISMKDCSEVMMVMWVWWCSDVNIVMWLWSRFDIVAMVVDVIVVIVIVSVM